MTDFWYDRTRFASPEEALAFVHKVICPNVAADDDIDPAPRPPKQPLRLRVIPGGKHA
jgi:hypothetical protein